MSNRVCSRGHHDRPVNGVCPSCKRISEEDHEAAVYEAASVVGADDDHGATFHPGQEEAG